MVTRDDVFIALSNSGESAEMLTILPVLKRQGAKLIAITGNSDSTLAQIADVHLDAGVDKEACPLNLAPTASTTAALAMGDALAVTLLDLRGFGPEDFARSHPGGTLGRRLLTRVSDIMRVGSAVPTIPRSASLSEALLEITRKAMAMTAVLGTQGELVGIFTDGDLRRLLEKTQNLSNIMVGDVMHSRPHRIGPDRLAAEAAEVMERYRINQLLVVDSKGALVGALHIHDLTNSKVI
jgi:arabinose-5-phosphate isomerase